MSNSFPDRWTIRNRPSTTEAWTDRRIPGLAPVERPLTGARENSVLRWSQIDGVNIESVVEVHRDTLRSHAAASGDSQHDVFRYAIFDGDPLAVPGPVLIGHPFVSRKGRHGPKPTGSAPLSKTPYTDCWAL